MDTIALPPGKGPFPLAWNGTDSNGAPLPAGSYSINVTASGAGNSTVSGTAQMTGTISAVTLGATTQLQIGDALVTPADVLSIGNNGGIQ